MIAPEDQGRSPSLDVLVVEDNPTSQRLIASILASAGHRVRIADNGLEAIRHCVRQLPDFVVIDLQMPILDGAQTVPLLRALEPEDRQAPIVGITAHVEGSDRTRFQAAGVDSFLAKPFEASALRNLVNEMWTRSELSKRDEHPAIDEERHATATVAKSLLDIPGALSRLGGDEGLLRDLIGFFFEDAFTLLADVHNGLASGEFDRARRAAHSLKGLASNFGAAPTVAALQAIETLPSAEPADLPVLLRDANRELAYLAAALADFSDERTAANGLAD